MERGGRGGRRLLPLRPSVPHRAGESRRVPRPREPGRPAREPGLRAGRRRPRGPHRKETALPLPPGLQGVLDRDRRVQLPVRVLPELADLPVASEGTRRDAGRSDDARRGRRERERLRLQVNLIYLYGTDDLLRVRARLREAGEGRGPAEHVRDERVRDGGSGRGDGRLARRRQRRPEGVAGRFLPPPLQGPRRAGQGNDPHDAGGGNSRRGDDAPGARTKR